MDCISSYKVLVVGDGIIDEYVYVTPLGMSAKESILAVKHERSERFSGGVWAAARHVEGFCGDVTLICGDATITKRRYVDRGMKKLFEVHEQCTGNGFSWDADVSAYDLVIAADFGHGAITSSMREDMTETAKYLAVNAQTNSANRGFNLITKYKRADFVVVDELEARLAAHDRESRIEAVVEKLGFHKIIVTRGSYGAVGFDGEFSYSQARAEKVVDTMGAGDAFFCVTAPLAAAGADMQTLLEVGNAAGAVKCGVVGHRQAVTKEALLECLTIEA